MPTARELLEQADALMRRNRGRELEPDVPELTDEVVVTESSEAVRHEADRTAAPPSAQPLDDVPELTDAIGSVEEVSIEPLPDDGDESQWLESMLGGSSVTGPAPDSIAVVPPSTLRSVEPAQEPPAARDETTLSDAEHELTPDAAEALPLAEATAAEGAAAPPDREFDAMLGPPSAEAGADREFAPRELVREPDETPSAEATADTSIAEVSTPPAPGESPAVPPSWSAIAEEVRMQVLQRIDIFTDTGLQGELAARLQPVVDRASADLIATINREVGQLLRTYVAEAIEREIEKWRESNP